MLIIAAIVAFALWWRARPRNDDPAAAVVDPLRKDSRGIDPRKIKVGDVVAHEGRDFLVRGTLTFDQDGFKWHEHHLDDTTTRRWLSVEDDEELELCLWEAADGPVPDPGPEEITYAGTTYRRSEHGQAQFSAAGSTGTAPSGTVEYFDYAVGDRRLGFERYGQADWEVGLGVVVNERTLDIYPTTS